MDGRASSGAHTSSSSRLGAMAESGYRVVRSGVKTQGAPGRAGPWTHSWLSLWNKSINLWRMWLEQSEVELEGRGRTRWFVGPRGIWVHLKDVCMYIFIYSFERHV